MNPEHLIEILKSSPAVDAMALNSAVLEFRRWGSDIARSLLDKQGVSEADLVPLLAKAWGVSGVDLENYQPPASLIRVLRADVADEYRALPLRVEGAFVDVAFEAPDAKAIDAVRVHTKLNVRPHIGSPKSIDRILAKFYGRMSVSSYQVDPRVTSGNFLASDVIDLAAADNEVGEASMSIPVDMSSFDDAPSTGGRADDATLLLLEQSLKRAEARIHLLEAHVTRDEDVLRRLFGFLIDKGVGTREEIVALLG